MVRVENQRLITQDLPFINGHKFCAGGIAQVLWFGRGHLFGRGAAAGCVGKTGPSAISRNAVSAILTDSLPPLDALSISAARLGAM